jgi:hypothetical protein
LEEIMGSLRKVHLVLIILPVFIFLGCATEKANYQLPYPDENAEQVSFSRGSEPYGLGGIAWGTNISTLQGMEHYRTDTSYGGIEFYIRKGEALRIGGETFQKVQYGFIGGTFYVGMIKTDGVASWNALKKAIFKHYGKGAKAFKNREEYLWTGEDVIMALRYDEDMKMGLFYIRSESIRDQTILKKNEPPKPMVKE